MAPKPNIVQIPFRVSEDLLKRIDRHANRMRKATPGAEIHRTNAVMSLVIRALADVEAEEERAGKRDGK